MKIDTETDSLKSSLRAKSRTTESSWRRAQKLEIRRGMGRDALLGWQHGTKGIVVREKSGERKMCGVRGHNVRTSLWVGRGCQDGHKGLCLRTLGWSLLQA